MDLPCKACGKCHLCWLASNTTAYASLFDRPVPANPVLPSSKPDPMNCIFRGTSTGVRVKCVDTEAPCADKRRLLPVIACQVYEVCTVARQGEGVEHCCRKCRERIAPTSCREISEPPPITVPRTKPLAVVTASIGDLGIALLKVSRPWMEAYAKRVGADFVILDWPGAEGWPISGKFQFGKVLELWDRALFIDADILADPDLTPNLFELVPENKIGMFDDLPDLKKVNREVGLLEELRLVRLSQGFPTTEAKNYWNTGVIVASKEHRPVFSTPLHPIQTLHCGEQHFWVARIADLGIPVHPLGPKCNWQWWNHNKLVELPPKDALVHFSGMHQLTPERRAAVMEQHLARMAGEPLVAGISAQPRTMNWIVGLTTVPSRMGDLLPRTLQSVLDAGFPAPRLFVDGTVPQAFWDEAIGYLGLEVTQRSPTIRTQGNWMLGLLELFIRNPSADRYAMFQDDVILSKGLLPYLERTTAHEKSYWNLYSTPANDDLIQKRKGGGIGWHTSKQDGKGALGLVFSREGVKVLLTALHMIEKVENRKISPRNGWELGQETLDGAVVTAMTKAGWTEMIHNPSLVQHTGEQSTMGHARYAISTTFRGESFDCTNLLQG